MIEQASIPELKPDSPSQMHNKHLENFHKTKAMLNFGFWNADSNQATSTNPFAALEANNPEAEDAMDNLEEMREGWTFQGRKKHTPKIVALRQVLSQSTTLTSNHDVTLGGRRKRTHSDVHCSYFTSLGISSPPRQEHARTRIWPVMSREKNAQKEILIYARNNALPGLPLSIRITSSSEEEWTHATALANITQSIESKLEDKILRYSLNLKDCLSLEWNWQEDRTRGGWECTILAHISTNSNAISVQNKKHFHWRLSDSLTGMNNDSEFSGPAHNLLLKFGLVSTDRQARKSESTSQLASPQTIRKKRFTKLDLFKLEPQRVVTSLNFEVGQIVQGVDQEKAGRTMMANTGSIGSPAAQD